MSNRIVWLVAVVIIIGAGYYLLNNQGTSTPDPTEITSNYTENNTLVPMKGPMTFFVTSTNPGNGGNFGGLAGADEYCQELANTAGVGELVWRAYLSTTGDESVNARDRIGTGPWQNANGVIIANNVNELHGTNNINKETALTEKGEVIKGRGDSPNEHDIITGSLPDGTAASYVEDTTCNNWTSGGEGSAIVGHHDRTGLDDTPPSLSWNSSHASRGCSLEDLERTGGAGLIYCFAPN